LLFAGAQLSEETHFKARSSESFLGNLIGNPFYLLLTQLFNESAKSICDEIYLSFALIRTNHY